MLKRCIALAVAAFLFLMPVYAQDIIIKTWLDEGESWVCEEHHVLYDAGFPDNYCRHCSLASQVQFFSASAAESVDIPYHSGGTLYASSWYVNDSAGYVSMGYSNGFYNHTFSSSKSRISLMNNNSWAEMSGNVWFYFEASFADLITDVNFWNSSYSQPVTTFEIVQNPVTGNSGVWLGFSSGLVWTEGGFNFTLSAPVADMSMSDIYYWDNQSDFIFPDPPDPPELDDPYLDLPVAPSQAGGYRLNASDVELWSTQDGGVPVPLSYSMGYYSGTANIEYEFDSDFTQFRFNGTVSSFSSYVWVGFDVYLSGYDLAGIDYVTLFFSPPAVISDRVSVYDLGGGYYRVWAAFDFRLYTGVSFDSLRLNIAHYTDKPVITDVSITDIYFLGGQEPDSPPPTIGSVTGGGSGSSGGSGSGSGGSFRPSYPPSKSDKWINDQFSGAVNPELPGKLHDAQSGIDQMDDFEDKLWEDYDQYLDEVDPSLVEFPTSFISAMIWIGGLFADLFDGLGEWQFIVTFPMFLGLALLVLGRGTQAMASTSSRHMRWNSRQAKQLKK